jgi:hypothetical protein
LRIPRIPSAASIGHSTQTPHACRRAEPVITPAAEHDEGFFAVRLQLASPNYVVDLELIAPARVLASPADRLQDFLRQLAITLGGEPKPPSFSATPAEFFRVLSALS